MSSLQAERDSNVSKHSNPITEVDLGPHSSSLSKNSASANNDRAARVVTSTLGTNANSLTVSEEPWMKTVVISTFAAFQREIFPIVDSIATTQAQFKDHSFVKQWKIYKNNARKPMCDTITWRNLKSLLGITELNQYRSYLQKCPTISTYVRLQPSKSTQSGFDYGIILQTSPTDASYAFIFDDDKSPVPETLQVSRESESTTLQASPEQSAVKHHLDVIPEKDAKPTHVSVTDHYSLQVFHKLIFKIVHVWAYSSDAWNLTTTETWRNAIEGGLTIDSSWQDIMALMKISSFHHYYQHIDMCGPLRQCYDYYWHRDQIKYTYRPLSEFFGTTDAHDTCSASSTTNNSNTNGGTAPETIPGGISDRDSAHDWLIVDGMGKNGDFAHLHMAIFDCISTWMLQSDARQYPFYMTWKRDLFSGVTKWSPWDRCSRILKLSSLRDYIDYVQQCPLVRTTFDLIWDNSNGAIHYREYSINCPNDISKNVDKLNRFQTQLRAVANSVEKTMHDIQQRITDTQDRIVNCEQGILNQLNRTSSRLSENFAKHARQLKDIALETSEQVRNKVEEITQEGLDTYRTRIATSLCKVDQRQALFEQQLEQKLDAAIEQALQEIHSTTDSATADFNKQAAIIFQKLQEEHTTSSKFVSPIPTVVQPSKRFPNVDTSLFLPRDINRTTQPATRHTDHIPSDPIASGDQSPKQTSPPAATKPTVWSKYGPPTNLLDSPGVTVNPHYSFPGGGGSYNNDGLPYLNHASLLKHTKEAYPGREQSYTWYMKFRSTVQQWGMLLIRIDDIKKDKSLCPTVYHGTTITPSRYQDMAFSLYQLLAQTSIISGDYTDLRNIINRHAGSQDGYRILYDIMERVHPRLDPDATFPLPQSIETTDIHEYYQQVDSYFMHERFAGRNYKPREQLNIFLRGLDSSYVSAINRIRRNMDTWDPNDSDVPAILDLSSLPNTIEKYMEEDGAPVIRTLRNTRSRGERRDLHRGQRPSGTNGNQGALKADSRKYIDVKCDLCNMYGHIKYDCDKMAVYLSLKDNEKKVDEKLKAKIQANFSKNEEQRRTKKVTKLRGTVRQLYTTGQFEAGDQLWNDLLLPPVDFCQDTTDPVDHDAASASSESS